MLANELLACARQDPHLGLTHESRPGRHLGGRALAEPDGPSARMIDQLALKSTSINSRARFAPLWPPECHRHAYRRGRGRPSINYWLEQVNSSFRFERFD